MRKRRENAWFGSFMAVDRDKGMVNERSTSERKHQQCQRTEIGYEKNFSSDEMRQGMARSQIRSPMLRITLRDVSRHIRGPVITPSHLLTSGPGLYSRNCILKNGQETRHTYRRRAGAESASFPLLTRIIGAGCLLSSSIFKKLHHPLLSNGDTCIWHRDEPAYLTCADRCP